ncbi:cell wall hydrolase [Sphingomonas sp. KRR8]|uniref:cell wall hydrolase n=1 Tax=Sphingomonas sp. KRR8 TaxID=2942996 RepID=UPI002021405E|nr:cell wall hydrolase [Sphingomonas sp. KRR8]URD61538.1 cell wall hydrolase [Sphingomonas sp. KRR8]
MLQIETRTGARHLQLGAPTPPPPPSPRAILARRRRRRLIIAAVVMAALAVAAALWWFQPWRGHAKQSASAASAAAAGSPVSTSVLPALPPPDLFRPLTPEDAIAQNAERPIVTRPDTAAAKFRFSGDVISRLRAVDCLTQAVYYEAASEGVDGGRAVAQVVLNRLRHPGFPNSVCGVVYQGSNKATGCQFTFTCDGSLAHVPSGYLWARSRLIATEALAGRVFAPVGHATHYHANYVLPYWADSLDKTAVIGRHIFYRLRGGNGASNAFSQRYAGIEPLPPPLPATDLIEQGLDSAAPAVAIDPNLPVAPKVEEDQVQQIETVAKPAPERSTLQADLARGQLILGEPAPEVAPAAKKKSSAATNDCGTGGASRVKAVGANDLKAVGNSPTC